MGEDVGEYAGWGECEECEGWAAGVSNACKS